MGFAGLDFDEIQRRIMARIMGPVEEEVRAYVKEREPDLEKRARELSKLDEEDLPPSVKRILEPLLALQLLIEQTLTEAAVVIAVAAYEAFLRDIVSTEVRRRPTLIDRFPEARDAITHQLIKQYGGKLNLARGEEVARRLNVFQTSSVTPHFKRIFGVQDVFKSTKLERQVHQLI